MLRTPMVTSNAVRLRCAAVFCLLLIASQLIGAEVCRIEVVDAENGWPVPMVELRTTHHARYVTDNAGVIALDAPELFGREVWFGVVGHGYGVKADGFGLRGVRLTPQAGKTLRVEVTRSMIAKRLGRITGAGIFAESQKLGEHADWRESGVFGCDSVQNAVHNGKHFWLWGDMTMPNYPLGVFDGTSATTALKPLAKFEPPIKLQLDYFRDDQERPRGVAKMPGSGPTWVTGYVSLPDRTGKSRLVGSYCKVKPPLEAYEWGLCVWNDDAQQFEPHKIIWTKTGGGKRPLIPEGHPALWTDEKGIEWLLIGNPLPHFRCPATFEAWEDVRKWAPLTPQKMLKAADGSGDVQPHSGSIAYNAFRKRWVTVFMQHFGKPSVFGELWYAEADAPTGPWGPAVKILTHENYTFYNPRLHAEFTPESSPILLFEGTYTQQFADKPEPTARYDYNQILYRLDLDDERLFDIPKVNSKRNEP